MISRRLFAAALTTSLAAALVFPASAQDIRPREFRFAMSLGADHPLGIAGQQFADRVSELSGGQMTVSFFPNAVLGSDQQNLSAVRGGTLDFTTMATGLLAGIDPAFMVFDLPFMFGSSAEAYALADGPVGTRLMAGLADEGIQGLGIWDLGFRNMTNSRRPVTRLEDVAGLRLRVIASPIYIELFTALGANPVPMTFGEVYGALESGAIDGQDNPLAVIQSARFAEVQRYLSITRHIYTGMPFLMSRLTWDALNDAERAVITQAADEARASGRDLVQAHEAAAIEELSRDMEVNELAPEEVARLREAVGPVVASFAQQVGAETMDEAAAELSALRGQ